MSKNKGTRKRNKWPVTMLVLIVFVALTLAGGILSYNYVVNNQKELEKTKVIKILPGEEIYIEVPKGADTSDIADILKENGLIKNTFMFKIMSKIGGYDGMYQSGTHKVSRDLTNDELMRVLTNKPESRKVTFPEGFTYKQVVSTLLKNNVITSKEVFDKAAASATYKYDFMKGLPGRENKLEGYLFPDTYEFGMQANPEEVINMMLRNFNSKFKEDYYKQAKKIGLTVDQVIILASIVEREAKQDNERELVAGVFYNRLKSKNAALRKLQSCATIQYIYLNKYGTVKERITEEDTKMNDPYNTYMIDGLPPGPICNPGEASIKAALFPDTEAGYLYFVSKGDGTHKFSKTYNEHLAAIKQYGQFN